MKHGQKPKSEYGLQFKEKQDVKNIYGLREKQFRRYFVNVKNPQSIVQMLDIRFDSVVYKCGFAKTRKLARQLVGHGHIQINGSNANLPSLRLKINDVISIHPSSVNIAPFKEIKATLKKYEPPSWIALDKENLSAKITALPTADDPLIMASIKPIMEFYSR
jgi:small subunit ribosomal protein S4